MMRVPFTVRGAPSDRPLGSTRTAKQTRPSRDLVSRLIGATVLGVAAMLLYVGDHAGWRQGPTVQLTLGLIAFCFACFGMLLVIEGKGLRACWHNHAVLKGSLSVAQPTPPPASELHPLLWDAGMGGGRNALTAFLILRAQQDAARRSAHLDAETCEQRSAAPIAQARP